jgi:hypothetical protein
MGGQGEAMNLTEFERIVHKEAARSQYGSALDVAPLLHDFHNERPGVDPVEMFNATVHRSAMDMADWMAHEVSIFADTIQTIVQEVLRPGIEWKERFAAKCMVCDYESKEEADVCPTCGSDKMRGPDKAELRLFSRLDGTSFIDRANDNGQSLMDILNLCVRNTVVFDRPAVLMVDAYVTDDAGEVQQRYPQEILALDPRFIQTIYDRTNGRLGDGTRVCLQHRDQGQTGDTCRDCGMKLYDVHYRSLATGNSRSYIQGEVITASLYHPYLLSGFPLVLREANEMLAYYYLSLRVRRYYEKGRPPGIIGLKTNNTESAYAEWQKVLAAIKEDPYYVPLLASDTTAGGHVLEFVSLMQDPNADMLAVKEEIRQRHGSMFGVTVIYQNDTSSSGGLKNDLNLIRVTRNTAEWIRGFINSKILRPLVAGFQIRDHELVVKADDDEDKAAEIELKMKEAEYAKLMSDIGIEPTYTDGKWTFASGPVSKPQPQLLMPPSPLQNYAPAHNPQVPPALPVQQPVVKAAPEMTDEEYCDSLVSKAWFFSTKRQRLIEALAKMQKMSSFQDLSPQEAEEAYGKIIDIMSKDKWTVKEVRAALQRTYPQLPDVNADAIARTESMAVAGKARELDFIENDPPDATYRWQGPDDLRTTEACREAVKGSRGGMPLEELKAYLHRVAVEHGMRPRDWVLHPNERHRVVRVVHG